MDVIKWKSSKTFEEFIQAGDAFLPVKNRTWVSIKADSHIACRAHAFPLPHHVAKGLECVLPI
jgi:hypothetical protein